MHPYEECPHISSIFRQCRNDHATILSLVRKIEKRAMCDLKVGDNFSDSDFHDLNMGITFDPGNYTDNQKTAFWLLWNCKKAIMQGGDVDPQTSIEIVRLYGELNYESFKGKKAADKSHEIDKKTKSEAIQFYKENHNTFTSKDDAATKLAPKFGYSFATVRGWLRNIKPE
jgi:hypothetical protein